jgi:hypothetical protein
MWVPLTFVYRVKYLGVIFNKSITWRLHIDTIAHKALKAFMRAYFLLKVGA